MALMAHERVQCVAIVRLRRAPAYIQQRRAAREEAL